MERFHSISEMMEKVAGTFPERPAIIYARHHDKIEITYRKFYEALLTKAEHYTRRNWHCIGMSGQTSPGWILSALSAAMAGKRVVLLDPSLTADEALRIMHETGVDYLYCDDPEKAKSKTIQQEVMNNYHLHEDSTEIECGGDFLFYTSGTTAKDKAVVLSQEALCGSAWNGQQMLACDENDVILSILPLYHVFGFICALLWGFSQGAAIALGRGIRWMHEDPSFYEPTILPLVPGQLKYLLVRGVLDPRLQKVLVGAGPVEKEYLDAVRAKNIDVRFGYGLTETASGLAMSLAGEDPYAMALCPDTKIRVGEDGELFVRTPCMMEGYYHMPEETAEVLQDGELATGDLVRVDDNGRLHITGRKKDILILSDGTKIFCPEEERKLGQLLETQVALALHDDRIVLIALASPMFREKMQERVEEYNKTLPAGQQIEELILRDEPFPRTATGRIKRYLL